MNNFYCLQEVVKACQLAMAYRDKFRKDVLIDYTCYRRWGHNELDEPAFTQPQMYNIIRNRQSIPDMYADKIVVSNILIAFKLIFQCAQTVHVKTIFKHVFSVTFYFIQCDLKYILSSIQNYIFTKSHIPIEIILAACCNGSAD